MEGSVPRYKIHITQAHSVEIVTLPRFTSSIGHEIPTSHIPCITISLDFKYNKKNAHQLHSTSFHYRRRTYTDFATDAPLATSVHLSGIGSPRMSVLRTSESK